MLALPLVLGLAASRGGSPAAWLVVPAMILAFLTHEAWVPLIQRLRAGKEMPAGYSLRRILWGGLYAALATGSFGGALLLAPRDARGALLAVGGAAAGIGLFYGAASSLGEGRRLWIELLGMAGMGLASPMIGAAAGSTPSRPWGAACLAFAYCASSVAYVRAWDSLRGGSPRAAIACVAAHAAIAAGLVLAAVAGPVPWPALLALAPVAIRTAGGLARPPATLRQVGLRELWVAVSFAVIAMAALLA
jgi:hypothetical protein